MKLIDQINLEVFKSVTQKKEFNIIYVIERVLNITQISFLVLKLMNKIEWNWFWVLSPIIFLYGLVGLIKILTILLEKINQFLNKYRYRNLYNLTPERTKEIFKEWEKDN